MKLAIMSDIHDNIPRLEEALIICKKEKINTCICCGDVTSLDIVNKLSKNFNTVCIALGNADFNLKHQIELFPENCKVSQDTLEVIINDLKIAIIHHDYKAKELAKENIYDVIFYGHTHTPWEKKYKKTTILSPGEVSGQRGKATFAIFDTKTKKAKLELLK